MPIEAACILRESDMGMRVGACVLVLLLTASGAFGEEHGDHNEPITIRTGNWG
jgi:hypothetical protein